ncbi:MAG: lipid A deacylase LpxR family protein [Chitinophagaceae bacterium]
MVIPCLAGLNSTAQRIDHLSTFRNIGAESYFRFHYDNDYFTATDKYYTQGITIEYVHSFLGKTFLTRLLWKPWKTSIRYGLAFNLFGYTPGNTSSDAIQKDDRPFDANLSLKYFSTQADSIQQQQLSASFSLGIMGPAALGKEIQTSIHRLIKNPLPRGWQHQISNDILLNYQLNYEKQLLSVAGHFLLNSSSELRLGTLDDKLSTGVNFMAGQFNKRWSTNNAKKRKTEYYLYGQGRIRVTGYDASLQGGLFNRKSPYIIPAKDITRIGFQADAGFVVNFKKLFLTYSQSWLSKEFRGGDSHRWGGVSIGFAL